MIQTLLEAWQLQTKGKCGKGETEKAAGTNLV